MRKSQKITWNKSKDSLVSLHKEKNRLENDKKEVVDAILKVDSQSSNNSLGQIYVLNHELLD